MSASAAPLPLRALAHRRAVASGVVAGTASLVLFVLVERRLFAGHFLQPGLASAWAHPGVSLLAGGRWEALGRLVPGGGASFATIVTMCAASAAQAMLAHDLARRGWPPWQATLGVLLNSANPVVLFLATSGTPIVFYAIAAGLVVLALDRVEAIGDTRALISVGFAVAAMLAVWPNALFWIIPMLAILPLALREARSLPSAFALTAIVVMPGLIVAATLILGAAVFGVSAARLFSVWASTLHGAIPEAVRESVWLGRFGGRPAVAFLALLGLCALAAPRFFMVLERLALRRSERARPATALAAALLAPLSGAMATLFWALATPVAVLAVSIGAVGGWSATTSFRRPERWLWIALSAAGAVLGWRVLTLWPDAQLELWRRIVLGT